MRISCRLFLLYAAAGALCVPAASGQDSQSLGDVARQTRQQKQAKTAQAKDAKPSKVITNEQLPEHTGPAPVATNVVEDKGASAGAPSGGAKVPAESWKSQIQAQKSAIASMQSEISQLQESIKFAPPNCVSGCVQWNERQREKQQQVERMQAQLEAQKKRLEDMQESARQQGYGSSVYDP